MNAVAVLHALQVLDYLVEDRNSTTWPTLPLKQFILEPGVLGTPTVHTHLKGKNMIWETGSWNVIQATNPRKCQQDHRSPKSERGPVLPQANGLLRVFTPHWAQWITQLPHSSAPWVTQWGFLHCPHSRRDAIINRTNNTSQLHCNFVCKHFAENKRTICLEKDEKSWDKTVCSALVCLSLLSNHLKGVSVGFFGCFFFYIYIMA